MPSPRADAELLAAHLLHVSRSEVARLALVGGTPSARGVRRPGRRAGPAGAAAAPDRSGAVPRPRAGGRPGRLRAAAGDRGRRRRRDRRGPSGPRPSGAPSWSSTCAPARPPSPSPWPPRCPQSTVVAVEVSDQARAWAAANIDAIAPGRVDLRAGDVTDPALPRASSADLAGRVDVVVSNPPYIPPGQEPVDPEVRDHDPEVALYGGGAGRAGRPARGRRAGRRAAARRAARS